MNPAALRLVAGANPGAFAASVLMPRAVGALPAIGLAGLGYIVGSGPVSDHMHASFKARRISGNPLSETAHDTTASVVPRVGAVLLGGVAAVALAKAAGAARVSAAAAGAETLAPQIAGGAAAVAVGAAAGVLIGQVDPVALVDRHLNPLHGVSPPWESGASQRPRSRFDDQEGS